MKKKKYIFLYIFLSLIIGFSFVTINAKTSTAEEVKKFKVCIDPGHQKKGINITEPNAPGSSIKKPKVSSGTRGVATKKWEYEVNLDCAKILEELLDKESYDVILTRNTNEVSISNIERANLANDCSSDLVIKIHCDSIGNSSKTGASILIPAKNNKNTAAIYKDSYRFARELETELKGNGIKVNGVFERNDMTGFNWSKVPVVTFEMGFMSNPNEDYMLNNNAYQKKLMECVKRAIDSYKLIEN